MLPHTPWARTVVERWSRDFRQAARSLLRAPGFSLAVIGSLVVCLGPNAATLSALYALVLKPLPFREPRQLVTAVNVAQKSGGQLVLSSTTQYLDFKAHADAFAGFATFRHESGTLDDERVPVRVVNDKVSANFFDLLGVAPVAGRFFAADDEIAGHDRVLVLSEAYWRSRYNADPAVIGTTLHLDGQPFTIVGVAPRSLEVLSQRAAVFQPYAAAKGKFDPQTRYRGDLTLIGRLKPGVPLRTGEAQLRSLEALFLKDGAGPALRALVASAGYRLDVQPLRPGAAVGPTQALWLLQGGAVLVLLIGCVNVVNLFLARLNAKRGELAIRVALGAGRGALIRQMLAESLLLTSLATGAGVLVALGALRAFNRYLPTLITSAPPVHLDPVVTLAIAAAAGLIALLVGFLPLRLLWRGGLQVSDARTASATGRSRAISGLLVTSQVAVAVVLLVGASLLLRSFGKVMDVDPGFDAGHVVQGTIALPRTYATAAARVAIQRRILDAMKEIPGVENAGAALESPVLGNVRPVPFALRGSQDAGENQPLIHILAVSPGFFATMGLSVVSGRAFNDADDFAKAPVALVDQAFRDRYFAGRPVEDQEVYLSWGLPMTVDAWPRIVGVVTRANLTGLDSSDNLPIVYVPTVGYASSGFQLLVRSTRPTGDTLREIRAKLAAIDPSLPLVAPMTLADKLGDLLMARRGVTLLLGVFSALALLLAAIGLYGVLSYDVSQRTREIGIRGAIGATRGQILALILRQGLAKTAVGLSAGLVAAALLSRYLAALLFAIPAVDPVSYLAALGVLLLVALIACWLPARRAAKVDPLIALRAE